MGKNIQNPGINRTEKNMKKEYICMYNEIPLLHSRN